MAYIGKSPTGTGVRSRYYFTATAGATSLSGADDNSNTLVFSDGNYVDVSLNGIALVAGTDYNTSTANTISGLSALSSGDIVEVVVYDIFTVADTVSAKDGGTFSGNVAMGGTLSVTGALTATTGTFSGAVSMGANNITFSDGNGIDFSASAGSGVSSSILDDYEEGTWTPRIRGGGEPATLITGNGVYTKIGNQVTVLIEFNNTNMAGYSGPVAIDSFPFAQASGFNAGGAAGMIYSLLGANANREHTAFFMSNNSTVLNLYDINAGTGWGASQHGAPAGAYFWTTFTYFTS